VIVLLGVMLAGVVWATRLGRAAAAPIAAGVAVVAFPFLYAAFPTSWYWVDGRYGVYLPPLLVLLAVWVLPSALAGRSGHRAHPVPAHARPRRPTLGVALALASAAVIAGAASTGAVAQQAATVPTGPGAFFSGWSDPNGAARHVVRAMAAHHIDAAYGDYWTAYPLDFLAPPGMVVSPSPLDPRRDPGLARAVAADPDPAWLFFAPGREGAAGAAFANPDPGPGGYSQAVFVAYLNAHGDGFRIVRLGVLDAVVPDHAIGPPPKLG